MKALKEYNMEQIPISNCASYADGAFIRMKHSIAINKSQELVSGSLAFAHIKFDNGEYTLVITPPSFENLDSTQIELPFEDRSDLLTKGCLCSNGGIKYCGTERIKINDIIEIADDLKSNESLITEYKNTVKEYEKSCNNGAVGIDNRRSVAFITLLIILAIVEMVISIISLSCFIYKLLTGNGLGHDYKFFLGVAMYFNAVSTAMFVKSKCFTSFDESKKGKSMLRHIQDLEKAILKLENH